MVRKEVVVLSDDFDGSTEDVVSRTFEWGGVRYEIDMTVERASAWDQALRPLVEHARRVKLSAAGSAHRGGGYNNVSRPSNGWSASVPDPVAKKRNRAIREWLEAHGFEVNDRGRIPRNLIEQYEREVEGNGGAANPEPATTPAPWTPPGRRESHPIAPVTFNGGPSGGPLA